MAQTIANAAMDKCKELGFRVSVTVVDRAGLPIVMLRGDGAGLHTPEGSDRKAYTARTFRAPSADFVKRMLNDPTAAGSKEYTRVLALSGGLPRQGRRRRGRGRRRVRIARQGRRMLQGRHRQGSRPAQVSHGARAPGPPVMGLVSSRGVGKVYTSTGRLAECKPKSLTY